jgi:hypothetical protein
VAVWQQVLLVIALPVLALVGRSLYVRFYLRKRLFFEPWANLSRDDQFNTGEGLAELLIFELDRVQTLLRRALTSDALWNEKVALPVAERSADGYSRVVKDGTSRFQATCEARSGRPQTASDSSCRAGTRCPVTIQRCRSSFQQTVNFTSTSAPTVTS